MDRSQVEKISKALADRTRLRIFEAISAKDHMNCGEIVSMRGVTPATVSHHLKILNEAGLIACRREGQFVYSEAVPETIVEYTRALAKISSRKKTSRRRFLSHVMKGALAAVCSQFLPPALRAVSFSQSAAPKTPSSPSARPQLALTLDDPTLSLGSVLKWQEANSRILRAISEKGVRAALFVCGMRVDEADGSKLLSAWDQASHLICNHSYSHKFYGEQTSYADFAADFLKNEKVIAPYRNRTALFRYPFLKEGDTADKRDHFRALLKERGYRVGHVTIDASDWYVSQRFVDQLAKQPKAPNPPYRDYLIAHLLDRAAFYRQLALDVLGRDIRHTLLMHFNPLNAFVLPEVMNAFEAAGWQWIDASLAFEEPIFRSQPQTLPAGESLVWALAKETGRFENRLRYPGEDDIYEKPKMDALGL
jgi:DNA-binding transcriptional ArsR family regulator